MAAAMGRAIQVVRTDRGWSRKDFAERTGLSYSFLSEIENGVKEPSSRTFALISNTLDVAPGALLYDAERRMSEDADDRSQQELAPSLSLRDEAAPTMQRSRRVLDWIAGPLARRSSEASGPESASIQSASSEHRNQTHLSSYQSVLRSPETGDSGVSVDQFLGALLPLLSELSPEDRELVLDLARRLSHSDVD
jgi:transcriptional regulator with XRE-family HTH domain